MNTDLDRAKVLLAEGYTCVLVSGEDEILCRDRGVSPILRLIEEGKDLQGFCVADKIVGRAVAFLLAYVGVKAAYAETITAGAVTVLDTFKITRSYSKITDKIINREGNDICPMEKAVGGIESPKEAYEAVLVAYSRLTDKN